MGEFFVFLVFFDQLVINMVNLDICCGEYIIGFFVCFGFWVDVIQVLISLGRRLLLFGNVYGGDV